MSGGHSEVCGERGLGCEGRLATKEVVWRDHVEHAKIVCVCGSGDTGIGPGEL